MHTSEKTGTSYCAGVFFTDTEPWLPKNRFTIDEHAHMDLVVKGAVTHCKNPSGERCDSIDECALDSSVFDLDKIKDLDITVVNPKFTDMTILEDVTVQEKRYLKELRRRTIVKTETVEVPRTVTVTKIRC
ncbi:MAG: hypothetical protein ACQESG_03460 [Nanobdellota archaeon]